jgi:hypothetical protein
LLVGVDGKRGEEVTDGYVYAYVYLILAVELDAGCDFEGGEVGVELGGEERQVLLDGGLGVHVHLYHFLQLRYLELEGQHPRNTRQLLLGYCLLLPRHKKMSTKLNKFI